MAAAPDGSAARKKSENAGRPKYQTSCPRRKECSFSARCARLMARRTGSVRSTKVPPAIFRRSIFHHSIQLLRGACLLLARARAAAEPNPRGHIADGSMPGTVTNHLWPLKTVAAAADSAAQAAQGDCQALISPTILAGESCAASAAARPEDENRLKCTC